MVALSDEERNVTASARLTIKRLIAAAVFLAVALALDTVVPTIEIAWVTDILILTIYLFVF